MPGPLLDGIEASKARARRICREAPRKSSPPTEYTSLPPPKYGGDGPQLIATRR
jgi:hypothetical protein